MKKLNLKNKATISILTTMLIICGCFFISPNRTYADTTLTIDGINYTVDSFTKDSNGNVTEIIKNGIKYLASQWARSNLNSNKEWAKTVASSIVTLEFMNATGDLIGAYDRASEWVLDGVNTRIGEIKDGWDSLKYKYAEGTLEDKNVWVLKKLLGATNVVSDVYGNVREGILDLANSVETTYRNYYDNTLVNTNDYARGNTKYYQVANTYNDTFYNTYENTYETINNYNYDITNNYYNYYTTENHYHVTNNINNTYVFNVGGNYDYSLYYRLPDGSNSYNLTLDQIEGIKTDFNVDNYEVNSSNTNFLGLYHFNGNALNTYGNNNYFINDNTYLPYSSSNYVDSLLGYDLGLMFSTTKVFRFDLTNIKNVYFKLYSPTKKLYINSYGSNPVSNSELTIVNGKYYIGSRSDFNAFYIDTLGSNSWNQIELNIDNNNIDIYVNGLLQSKHPVVVPDNLTINDFTFSSDMNIISFQEYEKYYKFIHRYSDNREVNIFVYKFKLNDLLFYLDSNNNFGIVDELRLSNTLSTNHDVNYLPFSDGIFYTLPYVDTNNKLLVKSDIAVNDFQFGGIRKTYFDSVRGDVFINLTNGVIDSIQQFDGHDWILKDGAIYSTYLGKWVNAVGYSIITGVWDYGDITANEVKDTSSLAKWLSTALNDLKATIATGFIGILDGIKELTGFGESTLVIDNANDVKIDQDIDGYLDELKVIDQTIQFNLDDGLGEDINEIKTLAQTITQPIFETIDDNGLNILLIAPLIIAIVRLVI